MKILKYAGDAHRHVPGAGLFKKGDERPVDDHIAESFDNPEAKTQGWTVSAIASNKKTAAALKEG